MNILHQLYLLARLNPGFGEDGREGRAHRQELAEWQVRIMDHEKLVEEAQSRTLTLHQRGHVHQHLDQRRVERIDITQVVDVPAGEERREHLLMSLGERADRLLDRDRVLRPQHTTADDVAELDILKLRNLETLHLM